MLNVPSEENQENETLNVSIIVKWAISITIEFTPLSLDYGSQNTM